MPDSLPFFLIDVFADEPLTGNPLAVVADADGLDMPTMQAVAREFNQSETTFVLRSTRDGVEWRLRSFTPAGIEVGGAGHNALGAWWWLATAGRLRLEDGESHFLQEIGGRELPVQVTSKDARPRVIAMEQESPTLGGLAGDVGELAASLGLSCDDLQDELRPRVASTGVPHLLVQAHSRDAVDRAAPDAGRLTGALRAVGGEGCYLYCLDPTSADATAYARFFNPTVGITEDPATGTAAGPLASYLVANGVVADGSAVVIEQGHAIGRPSRIQIRVAGERVTIAATCVIVAEGTLHL